MAEISAKTFIIIVILLAVSLYGLSVVFRQIIFGKTVIDGDVTRTVKVLEAQRDKVLVQNTGNTAIESNSLLVYVDNIKSTCRSWSREIINPGESSLCTLFGFCSNSVRVYAPDNYDTFTCK